MTPQVTLWNKVDRQYVIEERVTRYIAGRQVISSQELKTAWGISDMTLRRYIGLGMPKHPASFKDFNIFDILECAAWRDNNISDRGAKPGKSRNPEDTDEDEGIVSRKMKADADRAVSEAAISELKHQQLKGSLIEAETLDIAQAEMAVIYQTTYQNDKKTLPIQLEHKSSGEIREYLDSYYQNRMEDLDSLIHKEFPECNESVYEIMEVALKQLNNGVSPDILTFSIEGAS